MIELYLHKADWPDLKAGQLIEVNGIISETQNIKRLNISDSKKYPNI